MAKLLPPGPLIVADHHDEADQQVFQAKEDNSLSNMTESVFIARETETMSKQKMSTVVATTIAMTHPVAAAQVCKASWSCNADTDFVLVDSIRRQLYVSKDPFLVLLETENLKHVTILLEQKSVCDVLAKKLDETYDCQQAPLLAWPRLLERLFTQTDTKESVEWLPVLYDPTGHPAFANVLKPTHINAWAVLVQEYLVNHSEHRLVRKQAYCGNDLRDTINDHPSHWEVLTLASSDVFKALLEWRIYPTNLTRWLIETRWINDKTYWDIKRRTRFTSVSNEIRKCLDWIILDSHFAHVIAAQEAQEEALKEKRKTEAEAKEAQIKATNEARAAELNALLKAKEEKVKAVVDKVTKTSKILSVHPRSDYPAWMDDYVRLEDLESKQFDFHDSVMQTLSGFVEIENNFIFPVVFRPTIQNNCVEMNSVQREMLRSQKTVNVRVLTKEEMPSLVCPATFLDLHVESIKSYQHSIACDDLIAAIMGKIFVKHQKILLQAEGVMVWVSDFDDEKSERGRQVTSKTRFVFNNISSTPGMFTITAKKVKAVHQYA